ncbi:MAG: type II toxin-antitoxin system VapB family antitoxin [Rhodospirillales bacterium]|jgi:antitoxin VapB|nr:type II toxin-antitoxin system VapB family antitoxin [Rhodospirillales bacterium]
MANLGGTDAETERLAAELAALTGESPTQAIRVAVAERLERCRQDPFEHRRATLRAIRDTVSALPPLSAAGGGGAAKR